MTQTLFEKNGDERPWDVGSLQSHIMVEQGSINPVTFIEDVHLHMARSCRILIDGNAKGSGFLIGRDLVLTARHVVEEVQNGAATLINTDRITAGFLDLTGWRTIGAVTNKPLSEVVTSREPSAWERAITAWGLAGRNGPPPAETPPGPLELDYAILRLKEAIGEKPTGYLKERGWFRLGRPYTELAPATKLLICHQPQGQVLLSLNTDPDLDRSPNAPRVTYQNDTTGGSSGSLVATVDGRAPVAMHQFGVAGANARIANQGVPLEMIWADLSVDLQAALRADVSPEPTFLTMPIGQVNGRAGYVFKRAHDELHQVYQRYQSYYARKIVEASRNRLDQEQEKDLCRMVARHLRARFDAVDKWAKETGYGDAAGFEPVLDEIRDLLVTAERRQWDADGEWRERLRELFDALIQTMQGLDRNLGLALRDAAERPDVRDLHDRHGKWGRAMARLDRAQSGWIGGGAVIPIVNNLREISRNGNNLGAALDDDTQLPADVLVTLLDGTDIDEIATLPVTKVASILQPIMSEMSDRYLHVDGRLKRALE